MKRYATVDFRGPNASCLAAVSWTLTPCGNKNVPVIKIDDSKGRSHYVSVMSTFSSESDIIRLNGKFGQLLGLKDGEVVAVTQIQSDVASVKRVQVHCESEEDWDILEPNAESMTNNLLNELRVVYPGLRFPFWVSKSLTVNLVVDSLEPPLEFGILETFSEIVVPSAAVQPEELYSLEGTTRLRIQPVTLLPETKLSANTELLLQNTSHAFIFKTDIAQDTASDDTYDNCSSFYAKIIPEGRDAEPESIVKLKIFFIESILKNDPNTEHIFPHSRPPCLFVHHVLAEKLKLCQAYVSLEQIHGSDPLADVASSYSSPTRLETVTNNAQRAFPALFSSAQLFLVASLNLHFERSALTTEWGWMLITGKPGSGKTTFATHLCKDLEGFPYFVHYEVIQCSKLRGKKSETVHKELLTMLKQATSLSPCVIVLDDLDVICPSSKGEQQNAQEDFLHYRMCDTIYEGMMTFRKYQVAVICTARAANSLHEYWRAREGFHLFQYSLHIPPPNPFERLGIFSACLRRYQCDSGTSAGSSMVLPTIRSTTTSSTQSSNISQGVKDNSNLSYSTSEDGTSHMTQDPSMTPVMCNALFNLHDDESTPKAIHNIAKKWALICSSADYPSLSDEDRNKRFLDIIENEVTFSRHAKPSGKCIKWEDIGGLPLVKSELIKILQWPIKYAKLFDESPIKMPSGILLYGYPGTGKTLLGLSMPSLVANAKFIHIKGPELLSKYIGASEQAVQDLFQKAKDLSPCILFFDEFDSLVPRRGHDSTGVTDRVVNQFLAEMDGIEGGLGKGVYLVAATSRPDLIDPAVLRPGRLDRHLFFPLPDKRERLEIISTLGKDLLYSTEDGEILWDEIGRKTEGFTGADLHSLLCTAQLEAIQESLSEVLGRGDDMASPEIKDLAHFDTGRIAVGRRHITGALETFKPSLPPEELKKFKMIYERFSPGKQKGSKDGSGRDDNNALMEAGKKATLA